MYMKLQIGEKIKQLRLQNEITQEALAEILGVSPQSVSRWELSVCYPDLELLLTIANYFRITVDDLLGMAELRSEERRNALFTEAIRCESEGAYEAAIQILRSALKTNPSDFGLMAELSLALSKTENTADRLEAISLSEKVLEQCRSDKIRSTVKANLCFLYKDAGLGDKAVALCKTLPHIWESREMLLPALVAKERRESELENSIKITDQVLHDVQSGSTLPFSRGYK